MSHYDAKWPHRVSADALMGYRSRCHSKMHKNDDYKSLRNILIAFHMFLNPIIACCGQSTGDSKSHKVRCGQSAGAFIIVI